MSNKSTRPPLKVDETDLPQRKVVGPDGDDDLQILAAADQLSARHGALRAAVPTAADVSVKTGESPRAFMSLSLPDYLDRELSRRAADRRVSKVFLIVEALAKTGYEVKPEDMVGDRRRKRK